MHWVGVVVQCGCGKWWNRGCERCRWGRARPAAWDGWGWRSPRRSAALIRGTFLQSSTPSAPDTCGRTPSPPLRTTPSPGSPITHSDKQYGLQPPKSRTHCLYLTNFVLLHTQPTPLPSSLLSLRHHHNAFASFAPLMSPCWQRMLLRAGNEQLFA